ncbi:MAG: hypothetical protein V3V49_03490, partial [Candidatus Krumholzibacteria bacterium]
MVDTFILAFFSFDSGGAPDPQGWFPVDRTFQDTFFHVDDFAGLPGYAPLEGSRSMWCGVRPSPSVGFCNWATLPGYGNNWRQFFESVDFPVQGNVTLSYKVFWNSEPCEGDQGQVSYSRDSGQNWVQLPADSAAPNCTPNVYDWGPDSLVESFTIPGSGSSTIRVRFAFVSDGTWSDEDGLWPTDGAIMVDSITVADSLGVVDFQDFEAEPLGAHQTNDGHWQARSAQSFGLDFVDLFPGTGFVQDGCTFNGTNAWGFFAGSMDNYACGGHPEQAAVPMSPFRGQPWPLSSLYMTNEVWSPFIDWTQDVDGRPVPATATSAFLDFDVYRDLPLNNLVFYLWHVRGVTGGCPSTPWSSDNLAYWGDQTDWFHHREQVADNVGANPTEVQVALQAWDACGVWCNLFGNGLCHSHAPLFDNVRLVRVNTTGPLWGVSSSGLFQDNFAADGTKTGTVRIDVALDVAVTGDPKVVPGDRAAATVTA